MIKLMDTAMAKRSSEDWDGPPGTKATVVFGIIWFLASLLQLFFLLKSFKEIPSMAARGLYIMLTAITVSLVLFEVLYAVLIRTSDSAGVDFVSILLAGQFFWLVDTIFRPAVVLYLVHRRGDVLHAVQGNTTFPLSTRIWKSIVDWVLVAIALIMYIGSMGAWTKELSTPYADYGQINDLYRISLSLGQTGFAFLVLLCIDMVVWVMFQLIQGRGTHDPILNRLATTIIPLFAFYLFETAFFDIFPIVAADYDAWEFTVCNNFFDGAVRIAITTVLIHTMTLPRVLWTPPQVVEQDGIPGDFKELSTSSPINLGYTPQEQPASYWPQPHVLPHEMPLGASHEGNPYALPAGPITSPTVQQPVAEVYSTTTPATTPATTHKQPVTEVHSTTPCAETQAMPYQALYPASMRALPYQSTQSESTRSPNYPSPSLSSTQPLPYQIPSPVKAEPKQYQSVPSPTGELFTQPVLPKEKKEKE